MLKTYESDEAAFRLEIGLPETGVGKRAHEFTCSTARCRAQGVVSLDSICPPRRSRKAATGQADRPPAVRRRELGAGSRFVGSRHEPLGHAETGLRQCSSRSAEHRAHSSFRSILLVIQRKRLAALLRFTSIAREAYGPKDKRVFGYFAQTGAGRAMMIVAALDLKTDRERQAARPEMDLARKARGAAQGRSRTPAPLERFHSRGELRYGG
jgi:hypothetical protein